MKKFANILGLILFVGILCFLLLTAFLPNEVNGCSLVEIEKGHGVLEIAAILEDRGVISSKYGFVVLALLTNQARYLKAGVYEFCYQTNVAEVLSNLADGTTAKTKIILLEGWTINDIAAVLEKNAVCLASDFQKAAEGLEGYLFPDTYYFDKQTTANQVIAILRNNFNKKIDDVLLVEIESRGRTLEEIIIMAAMLEREVRSYEDKQMVAGILWKRLANNWKLQVDATLVYVLGKPGLRLTLADLNYDSPYNTYRYVGLPIGPISNPGLESVRAAVFYKENDYWFYLSAKDDGRTIFSKTLQEHELARKKYLR